MRVKGSLWWLHVVRSEEWTYYHLDPSKGHEAIEAMGVLLVFAGILVHDHYKVYFRYAAIHVLCNAHHLRELQGVVDRDCNYLAVRLQRLLRIACHLRNCVQSKLGIKDMPVRLSASVSIRFASVLLKKGSSLKPSTWSDDVNACGEDKVRNTNAFNLVKRLVEFKEETLRFMTDIDIPFDNNGSEQDVRNGKVKQKISGCFRSEKGAKWYCRIRSYRFIGEKAG